MARRAKGGSRAAAAAARRISVPEVSQNKDYENDQDTPEQSAPATPGEFDEDPDQEQEQDEEQDQDQDEDQEGEVAEDATDGQTPAGESDQIEETSNPPTPHASQSAAPAKRGRRPARASRSRLQNWDTPDPAGDEGSEAGGTPRKRGRGRGGGFRGRSRWATKAVVQQTRQTVDKDGTQVDIIDDEAVTIEDPDGETKVDKNGYLLGGRDYRVRVFTIIGRGKRLYMLSTEPARCTGFRDSYLFFNKHMTLVKIIIDDYEKRDLISRDIIPHSYKGRSIGVVTARSVFREFGSRIVIGGKKVVDDYQEQAAKLRGDVEGELADPYDRIPATGETYNKNQYVAWHGASSVYHTNVPTVPVPNGKPVYGKRKATITSANWMFEHARATSVFNSQLAAERKKTMNGVYDPHTNIMSYPAITQPTHARWEAVIPPPTSASKKRKFDDINNATLPSTNLPAAIEPPTSPTSTTSALFPPLSNIITRNYLVIDTHLQTPPHAALPPPGPYTSYTTPSATLPTLDAEDLASLPDDCRAAFLSAKAAERHWRDQWGTEAQDGLRGALKIGVGV